MHGQNDWGIPDWRDREAYPPVKSAPHIWAWEFLRRNPVYRQYWTDNLLPILGEDGAFDGTMPNLDEAMSRFGLAIWSDPRTTSGVYFSVRGVREIRGRSYSQTLDILETEVAYIFDLTIPLEAQFERAQAEAKDLQKRKKSNGQLKAKPAIKMRAEKYATYLRILDAEDAGVLRATICAELFGNTANDQSQSFDNARAAAHDLRADGYRALASISP